MSWKLVEFERAMLWNNSQSCLSMRLSRTVIEFSTFVEVIVSSRCDNGMIGSNGVADCTYVGVQ